MEILGACVARLLVRARAQGAVVKGKFLKVREDGQRKFCAPSIPAKLEGWAGVSANVHAAFLCLSVKLRQGTDAEGVVRCLLLSFYIQAIFGNDFPILRRRH